MTPCTIKTLQAELDALKRSIPLPNDDLETRAKMLEGRLASLRSGYPSHLPMGSAQPSEPIEAARLQLADVHREIQSRARQRRDLDKQIDRLEKPLTAGRRITSAQTAIRTAQEAHKACIDAVTTAQATADTLARLMAQAEADDQAAQEAAATEVLELVKAGKVPPESSGRTASRRDTLAIAHRTALATLASATAQADQARQTLRDAEQSLLEAQADATMLVLLLAQADYVQALAEHMVQHRIAHNADFYPDDAQVLAQALSIKLMQ